MNECVSKKFMVILLIYLRTSYYFVWRDVCMRSLWGFCICVTQSQENEISVFSNVSLFVIIVCGTFLYKKTKSKFSQGAASKQTSQKAAFLLWHFRGKQKKNCSQNISQILPIISNVKYFCTMTYCALQ